MYEDNTYNEFSNFAPSINAHIGFSDLIIYLKSQLLDVPLLSLLMSHVEALLFGQCLLVLQ